MSDLQPSEAQLEILQILWRKEPTTIKEIHAELSKFRKSGITTLQKQIQRMVEKGLIEEVGKEGKSFRYQSKVKQKQIRQSMFQKFLHNVFKGSSMEMVMHALGNNEPSEEELAQLEEWIKTQKNLKKS